MKTIRTWLATIAVLLCSITANAVTYSDWTSTNQGQSSSTSSNTYTITASVGDVLSFDWLVSSESNYDKLIITIGGTEILNKSGELSGTYQHTFASSGTYSMVVKYTKDVSVDRGSDYAKVYNIALNTGNNSGDSNTENIVASGTCGDNITWKLHNDGTLTIEGTGRMTSSPWLDNYGSEIKTVIIGEGVTNIRNSAFYGCSSLISITIPESVTSIGDFAFRGCSSLASVPLPESLTRIGRSAFYGCSSLTSITIPEDVTSIENSAFYGCSSLISITIPEGVTSIENSVFSDCSKLISIIVEEDNLVYDSRENCNAIIKTETNELIAGCQSTIIPNSVTSIGYSAFSGCCSLTAITIPRNVTSIGDNAFNNCNNLISIIVEEGNLVYDSRENCNAIIKTETNELIRGCQSTIIPNSVISIGWYAFLDCTGLNAITIPESVTSIESNAFSGCANLTHITIPNSMTRIAECAFRNTNLPIDNDIRYADTWAVEVTDDTKDKYTLRNNTTGIAESTFSNCTNLTSITIPESVTSIGHSAFSGCSSLTTINIPEGVTSIGQNTFSYTNLPVENNIRYAGTWVVGVTDNTKDKYTLRDNTTGIADYMFQNCSMTEITLPNNLKYIGNYVCANCRNLTSLTIPNSVTSIGEAAFIHCWCVTSLTIPRNVTSIGERAFTGRGDGTSIVVDANNTVYDSRGNCNAIICTETNHLIVGCSTTIIPNSVTSIGEYAFMSCGISTVFIPNGVTRIKCGAFQGSGMLTSISIPCSVTDIESYTFASCRSLKTIICRNVVPPTCEEDAFQYVDIGACALEVPLNSVATYRETSPWSGFNISAIVPQTLVLNDGEIFENEENMIVEGITYTRTFNNINWQALYVPFEIPVTEEFLADFEVADLNDVRQYDRDDDGVKDETVIEAFKVTSGALAANYPYLIRAKEAGEKTITVTDATLFAAEENSIDCSSVRDKFTFTGTYRQLSSEELPQGEGYYALSGGIWRPVAEGTSLGAFRFYLKVDSRSALNAGQGNAIRMRIIGEEDDATGIDNLEFENQNSESIFDLQGRRVENPTKGVYIVNGVKRVF